MPPGDPAAWYAPDVRDQYEVGPGVVATIRQRDSGFEYGAREPSLSAAERRTLNRVREHFAGGRRRRPRTREGTVERARAGLEPKYRRALDRLLDAGHGGRRRLDYYALRDLRLLGAVTPLALDDRVEVADLDGDRAGRLVVHTANFAPATTRYPVDAPFVDRVAADRLRRYTVRFAGFDVPVIVHRDHLLGDDRFATRYAVAEPDLLPGDEELVAECKERIWETNVDVVLRDGTGEAMSGGSMRGEGMRGEGMSGEGMSSDGTSGDGTSGDDGDRIGDNGDGGGGGDGNRAGDSGAGSGRGAAGIDRYAFVADRARQLLARRLTARNAGVWLAATRYRLRSLLADLGLGLPPADDRYARDRLDDLVYHVLRDLVGEGPLTVPIRDPHLEDVEANRVGERVKVIPRTDVAGGERVPTDLVFDSETAFVNVVTQLAASDGVELNASNPSAKVNLDPPGVEGTIRCAVALPVISADGPHVSIRKQAPSAMTPVDLVERDALATDLVALLWLLYEHRGVVLFSGPTGVGKTTLMNAHMPFVPFDDRPISIDEGSREVRLPHETGLSLTTRDHENPAKRVTMADLMTESNYLNPDVEVVAEINTPASFETFAEVLNTGHGVIGTTHAEDVQTLVNRVIERGLPPYLLEEIDLVVFPHAIDGHRYVARAVEFVTAAELEALEAADAGRAVVQGGGRGGAGPQREPDADGGSGARIGPGAHGGPDEPDPDATAPTRGVVEKGDVVVHWNEVYRRSVDGSAGLDYDHPHLGGETRRLGLRTFHRVASATDRTVTDVEAEFHRKHRYVRYLVREGVADVDVLFALLSDLRTDEAATVERLRADAGNRGTSDAGDHRTSDAGDPETSDAGDPETTADDENDPDDPVGNASDGPPEAGT